MTMLLDTLEIMKKVEKLVQVQCHVNFSLMNRGTLGTGLALRISAPYKETCYNLERVFTERELKDKLVNDDLDIQRICEEFNRGYREVNDA